MKNKRFWAFLIFLVMSFSALSFSLFSVIAQTSPVLYRNDTKYTINEFPPETSGGVLYVPVSFFVGLSEVQYEFDRDNRSFFLRSTKTGRFFSFSFDSDGIVVDNAFVNVSFPLMNSTVYLPLEYCAEILSLKVEKNNDGGIAKVRLTDGSEKLSFKELIELYDPTTTDKPPVINPEDPTEPTQPEDTTARYIYITIDSYPDTKTAEMINMLRDWGEKATFFFTSEAIKEEPDVVLNAFSRGHGIGITSSPDEKGVISSSITEAKKELDATNRVLYEVLGFCSRLYRFPPKTVLDAEFKGEIDKMGYVIWDFTIENASPDEKAWTAAKRIYDSTLDNDITVLRLTSHDYNLKVLTQLLSFIVNDEYITARIIDPTVKEYNFSQQNSGG